MLMTILNYIGSALPLCILCLEFATIVHRKTLTKKAFIGYIVIAIIAFLILLRT